MAKAHELVGDRMVEVAAGDVGGQVLAAGLVDEVIQGDRVLHLRYRARRSGSPPTDSQA